MKLINGVTLIAVSLPLAAAIGASRSFPRLTSATNPAPASIHTTEVPDDKDAPECPGPYFAVPKKRGSPGLIHVVEIAEGISEVPEFHDCQRFIRTGMLSSFSALFTGPKYGALYAIFVSDSLERLMNELGAHALEPVAVAEVYTSKGKYPELGIKEGFNCLYLTSKNSWEAYMVAVGETAGKCTRLLGGLRVGAKKLTVRRVEVPHMIETEYPAVARWDRDLKGRYFIGVKCGAAWCEVGLQDTALSSAPLAVTAGATHGELRVRQIKGWYDQQSLAIPSGLHVRPQPKIGTVIPNPDLGDNTFTFAEGVSTAVATIEIGDIPEYKSKLGLTAGTNSLSLRVKDNKWTAEIKNPATGTVKTLKVIRRDHTGEGFKIPGTVRWRWLAGDETIWVRCLYGCCQVQQDSPATEMPTSSAPPTL